MLDEFGFWRNEVDRMKKGTDEAGKRGRIRNIASKHEEIWSCCVFFFLEKKLYFLLVRNCYLIKMNLRQKLMFNLRSTITGTIDRQPSDFAKTLKLSRRLVKRTCRVFASCDFVTVKKNENCVVKGQEWWQKVNIAAGWFCDLARIREKGMSSLSFELSLSSIRIWNPIEAKNLLN